MKKRNILSVVMVLLVSAALCGCAGGKSEESSEPVNNSSEVQTEAVAETAGDDAVEAETEAPAADEPVQGGSVVVGMTQDLVSLDPHQSTDAGTRGTVFNMYEGLVKPTADGDLIPAVAESYEISEDATTYTFTLRSDVKFHDGTVVTVDDVKYSLERYAEIQGESSAFSSALKSVEVVDDATVVVTLNEGDSEFLPNMAGASIIPAANEDPEGNPIGTGPFKYVSYTPGQNLKLAKHDEYWIPGCPSLDAAEFKFIADVETAYTELNAGTIDILNYLTIDQVDTLSSDFNVVTGSMMLVQGMFLNNTYEPLQNTQVRQAICYAVDRDSINEFLFGGASEIIGTHMIPALKKYYNENTANVYSYDPEKAKELLAEAGYADGFDLEIAVPSSYSQHVDTAQIIAENLAAVGINATIKQVEWATWLSDIYQAKEYQATVIGFDGTLAPSDWLKKYTSAAGNNLAKFNSPEYDEVFAKAYASIDPDEKAELYKQCEQILADEAASLYIQDPADFTAVNAKFAGYQFYPVAAQDLSTLYVVE